MQPFWNLDDGSGDLLYNTTWGVLGHPKSVSAPPVPVVLPPCSVWAREQFGFEPSVIQKSVLDSDTQRLILCCNRQWGKSTVIALKALHYAIQHPNSVVVVLSRTEKQGGHLIGIVEQFTCLVPLATKRVRGYVHSVQLPNGARIYAIAHSADSSPGRTADVLIVDEAARVHDTVFSLSLPFVARTGGALWILSTPRGQTGFFYNLWHDNDPQWTRVLSTLDDCPGIPESLVNMLRKLNPHLFRQEFYCEFTPAAGRLISRERLQAAYNPALSARKLPPLPRLDSRN